MDRSLQPARRAGDDDARHEHDPAPADAGTGFLIARGARRCVVRVRVGTRAIRALFQREKPPVPAAEWDDAGYVEQRLHAYRDALDGLALVVPMSGDANGAAALACPRTGDRLLIDIDAHDAHAHQVLRDAVERAALRVFADANAWRRHLLPAYFERHRSWRAVAGGPIQH